MTYSALYETATGKLVSTGTVIADPLPGHLTRLDLAGPPDLSTHEWNETTKSFVVKANNLPTVEVIEFLQRFDVAERIGIRTAAKTDPVVEDFMDLVNKSTRIDLNAPDVTAGLDYMVGNGLLTSVRKDQILS